MKRFTLSLALMAGLAILFGFPAFASATTYCVRADGSATKINATGPSTDATKCMPMSTVNSSTFLAGDIVQLSDKGGAYAVALTIPSGGSAGNYITYQAVPGESPLISQNASIQINTNGKSFINIQNLAVSSQSTSTGAVGIYILGASNDISISSTTITMLAGYYIISNATSSNITIDGLVGIGGTREKVYFFGATNQNIIVKNASLYRGTGSVFNNVQNLTLQNMVDSSSTASSLSISNGSGLLTIDNFTSNNAYARGIYMISSNFSGNSVINNANVNFSGTSGQDAFYFASSSNITISNSNAFSTYLSVGSGFVISGNSSNLSFNHCSATYDGNGFQVQDTSSYITFDHCVSDYNKGLGFLAINSSSNVTYNYCEASYNGTVNGITNGGAFIPHNSATSIRTNYFIAHHNYNEGIGDVSTGVNNFYNGVNWANGNNLGDTYRGTVVTTPTTQRGNLYFTATNGVGVKNIISGAGKPREVSIYHLDGLSLDYNIYNPIDNNVFITNDFGSTQSSWSAYHATNEANSQNADPQFVNGSGSYSTSTDFMLLPTSPAIDVGTGVGLITDYAGNSLYGTPDIGAYEYQPPFTFASNRLPITGSARLYSDGKYRMTTASSSVALADFSVTPASGSYYSTTTQYLDLTLNNWDLTGDKNKKWTATSTAGDFKTLATSTVYTIGDLVPNVNYTFKLDGSASTTAVTNNSQCTNGVCMADGDGKISFTYVGGYSTHTFELIKDSTAPAIFITTPTESAVVSGKLVDLTATASDNIGVATVQFKIDGSNHGSVLTNSPFTTTWDSTTVSDGHHTVSATACDASGNCTNSDTVTFGVGNNGSAPIYSPPSTGSGSSDATIPMGASSNLGALTSTGTNLLAYINSVANFTLPTSGSNTNQAHKLTITGLDLAKNIITLLIESTPQTITLSLNETSNIDLDQDKKPDVSIKFAGLFVNRAELTIKPLINNSPLTTTLVTSSTSATTLVPSTTGQIIKINAKDRPAVYYIENGKKYSFVNRGTYSSWSLAVGDSKNSFATLKSISQTEFDQLLFGGNLAIKPGNLVKFTDSASVYGVGTGAKLYRLADKATQTKLYGNSTSILLQSINRANYFDNGNFVAELLSDSVKPE